MEWLGIILALIGLVIAAYQARRARSAAEAARDAAHKTREALLKNLTISDLARASERIQHLKDLHQLQHWQRALDQYFEVRRFLVDIRGRSKDLTHKQETVFQEAVAQLRIIEDEVRIAINQATGMSSPRSINAILTQTQGALQELGTVLQSTE